MENDNLFYILGGALVVAAVVLSAIGLRAKEFPSGMAFRGVLAAFAALVVATSVFAVRSAGDEQHEREENEAAEMEEAAAGEAAGVAEADEQAGPQGEAPAGQGETLQVSSPADGSLSFEPPSLDAKAGTVTIAYDNPSPVPHNVAVESPDGEELGASETGADGEFAVTVEVASGDYVYFCAVPGHRQGGMEGKLTVK